VEDNAKRIYIINLIEHSTSEAINSLLKFLEEPDEDTYAIITTENINNVLPTIISRCLNLRLSKASKRELVVEAIKKGITLEDALILASFNGSMSLIEDCYNNSKYISLKDLVIEMFNEYVDGGNILYFSEVEMNDVVADKNNFRLFLDILDLFLLDVINCNSEEVNFVEHKELLTLVNEMMPNLSSKVEKIMRYKSQIDLNANLKLLLDSVIINLKGE
jgi:DNA polymerase-3 subunit delta'